MYKNKNISKEGIGSSQKYSSSKNYPQDNNSFYSKSAEAYNLIFSVIDLLKNNHEEITYDLQVIKEAIKQWKQLVFQELQNKNKSVLMARQKSEYYIKQQFYETIESISEFLKNTGKQFKNENLRAYHKNFVTIAKQFYTFKPQPTISDKGNQTEEFDSKQDLQQTTFISPIKNPQNSSRCEQLEKEIYRLNKLNNNYDDAMRNLKNNVEGLEEENNSLKDKIEEIIKQNQDLFDERQSLKDTLSKLQRQKEKKKPFKSKELFNSLNSAEQLLKNSEQQHQNQEKERMESQNYLNVLKDQKSESQNIIGSHLRLLLAQALAVQNLISDNGLKIFK